MEDEEVINKIYEEIDKNLKFEDYTIRKIETWIKDDYIYNKIEYYLTNELHQKIIRSNWKEVVK